MVERAHRPSHISPITRSPQPLVNFNDDNTAVTARLPSGESCEVLLYGATVTSWKSADGRENLWLSDKAVLDGSKAVRGGVPLVFPVFGPPPKSGHAASSLPQHGFARSVRWEYLGKSTTESAEGKDAAADDNSVKLDFGLYSSALPEKLKSDWPYDFGLVYSVTLSPEGLRTTISVRNEGAKSFEFKILFHTYLRVKDVTQAKVTGLSGVTYSDKVLDRSNETQSSAEISISGEIDRVYSSIPQSTTSVVEAGQPRFDIVRDNLSDVVVWNPWKEKAQAMGDWEPKNGYLNMLCVETGSVCDWQTLEGGEAWEGGQTIKSL